MFSLTSLTNEPKPSHKSADETGLESWNRNIAPPALSAPSSMIQSLFLKLASTAGVKGNWTGLTAWKTEILQVKHKEFKSGWRWNCSLLCEMSAFQEKGTARLWSILSLSFSLLLQSLWATLKKCNHHQTQNKAGEKKISWFREVEKPGSQAVSLQELEKAAAFYSHLELNCHLKELSSAFIPKKKQLFVGSRQTGKHTGNCFVDQLPLLSPHSK